MSLIEMSTIIQLIDQNCEDDNLDLVINFSDYKLALNRATTIRPDDIDYRDLAVQALFIVFPVTANKFSFINQMIEHLKKVKFKYQKILFIERRTLKVQGYIQEALPMLPGMSIGGVFNTAKCKLCSIQWNSL